MAPFLSKGTQEVRCGVRYSTELPDSYGFHVASLLGREHNRGICGAWRNVECPGSYGPKIASSLSKGKQEVQSCL